MRLERNQGVAAARNVGIFSSSSQYIAFLDDDDLKLPRSLDLQRDILAANPEAGFICGGLLWNALDRFPRGEYRFAIENVGAALRLNPLRAGRPGAYKKVLMRFLNSRGLCVYHKLES